MLTFCTQGAGKMSAEKNRKNVEECRRGNKEKGVHPLAKSLCIIPDGEMTFNYSWRIVASSQTFLADFPTTYAMWPTYTATTLSIMLLHLILINETHRNVFFPRCSARSNPFLTFTPHQTYSEKYITSFYYVENPLTPLSLKLFIWKIINSFEVKHTIPPLKYKSFFNFFFFFIIFVATFFLPDGRAQLGLMSIPWVL